LILLCGCTTTRETYRGKTADQVWAAMVAVANTPDYWNTPDVTERWHVRENAVWDDEANRRIEVFRKLERELHLPNQPVVYEKREWRFEVTMEQEDPPVVKFTSCGAEVPAHAWHEADRFFDQVWELLGIKDPPKPVPIPKVQPTRDQRNAIEIYDG
jgi:hypothetical protein